MKNEGAIERGIQAIISTTLLASGLFLLDGTWQIAVFVLSAMIGTFAMVGFCPLYAIIGRNTAPSGKSRK